MKYPKIICIDGVDGSGKKTVSNIVAQKLTNRGFRVARISPPFYDTKSGELVAEYLTQGYGDIRDRKLASLIYSVDRNIYFKNHFNEIFKCGQFDFVLYDRNWLSNLFFQTTLHLQTEDDETLFKHPISASDISIDCARFNTRYDEKSYLSLADMHDILITGVEHDETYLEALACIYKHQRRMMIRDHINFILSVEILPWKLTNDYGENEAFTKLCDICNIVLTPQMEIGSCVLHDNMMKRYDGDLSKFDRNERSKVYLDSVIENIHWIHASMNDIFNEPLLVYNKLPIRTQLYLAARTAKLKPVFASEDRATYFLGNQSAFNYDIIHTTSDVDKKQRSIDDIVGDVWVNISKKCLFDDV